MRIGIIGGGQLGRMMAFEAKKMGFTVTILDPIPQSPAGQVSDRQIIAQYTDKKALFELARNSDVITVEVEIHDEEILHSVLQEIIENGTSVHPLPETLGVIQDKLIQKQFLKRHKIPVPDFLEVKNNHDIEKAIRRFGFPLLLKARTGAYDGRGNHVIKNKNDMSEGLKKLKGRALYVEKFVPFTKELAIMVARNTQGEIKVYPLVETVHKNNICHTVFAPADVSKIVSKRAKTLTTRVVKSLSGAGVFGIEMFLTKDNRVLVNEIAPRVHNSGHYTIEACITSQFEQHIRAISGLPLGITEMLTPASVMVNILGDKNAPFETTGIEKALKLPGVSVHIYGKADTKIERKMGHITAIGIDRKLTLQKAKQARKLISV